MTENAYLVGLRLAGKKVVVVGGGTVAQRRVPVLISHGAQVHVVSLAATPAVEALAEQNPGITLDLRAYREGDLDGAWYAIAATDDESDVDDPDLEGDDIEVAVVAEPDAEPASATAAQIGFIVAKSVGGAVERHRVARRLRHAARALIAELDPADRIVVRALPGSRDAISARLREELRAGVRRAHDLLERRR